MVYNFLIEKYEAIEQFISSTRNYMMTTLAYYLISGAQEIILVLRPLMNAKDK